MSRVYIINKIESIRVNTFIKAGLIAAVRNH